MAATKVGWGKGDFSGVTTASVTISDGTDAGAVWDPAEDDFILLYVASQSTIGSAADETTAGWFNTVSDGFENNSGGQGGAVWYHWVTAGEAAASTVTYAPTVFTGVETGSCMALVARGVDTTTPIHVQQILNDATATVTPSVLSGLTGANQPSEADCLVVSGVFQDGTGTYNTDPTGWTVATNNPSNKAAWLGTRDTNTSAGVDVAATNITPDAGDDYSSYTFALLPAAGGATDLVVADVAVVVVADNVVLTQVHTLAVADVAVVVAADNVALTQVHQLVVADVAVTVVADNVTLTQVHTLAVADVAVVVAADNVVLTQVHNLVVADVAVVVVADNVELDAGGVTNLVVADVAITVVADNVVLTQDHQLVVADVAVIVVADVVELESEGFELTERQAVHATLIGTAANIVTLTGSFARAQIINHDDTEPLYVFASSTGATPPVVTAGEAGSRIVPAIGVLSMRVTGAGFVATVVGDGNSYSVVGYDNHGDGVVAP
jgi:hypothetical protein